MIYQTLPRKGYESCRIRENEGFFIEGINYDDCINQLRAWCENHKEKWVYCFNCGMGPAKPVPVARNVIELHFFDREPARPFLLSGLFQKGASGEREIDFLTDEERSELYSKQMRTLAIFGKYNKWR